MLKSSRGICKHDIDGNAERDAAVLLQITSDQSNAMVRGQNGPDANRALSETDSKNLRQPMV